VSRFCLVGMVLIIGRPWIFEAVRSSHSRNTEAIAASIDLVALIFLSTIDIHEFAVAIWAGRRSESISTSVVIHSFTSIWPAIIMPW